MVRNKKIFTRSSVKYWTFSKGPTLSDLFPLCSYKKRKSAKSVINYAKIEAWTVKAAPLPLSGYALIYRLIHVLFSE